MGQPRPRQTGGLLTVALPTALLLALALAGPLLAQPEAEVHGVFHGDPMYTVLPPDRIPAIDEPVFLRGEEAAAQMTATEPVIGLVLGGRARAYSMWQLDAHEIVNDTLAGTAIAATW